MEVMVALAISMVFPALLGWAYLLVGYPIFFLIYKLDGGKMGPKAYFKWFIKNC